MSNQFGFDFDLGPTRFIRPEERESAAPDLGEFWKQSLQDRLNVSNIAGGHVKTAHEAFAEIDDDLFQATGSRLPSLDRTTPEDWSVEYGKLREKHPDRLPWATQQEFDIELSRRANEKIKSTRERMSEMSQQAGMIEAADVPVLGKVPVLGAAAAFGRNLVVHPQYSVAQLSADLLGSGASMPDAMANAAGFWASTAKHSILNAALRNAGANAVLQMPLSALKQGDYRDAGLPYGFNVWLAEVEGAAAAGFALDAGIRGPARVLLPRVGRDVPAGEMLSRHTERAGLINDLPEKLDLPARPAARETESVSRETWEKAQAGDIEALKEVAARTGAIEDPAVKGMLHHVETGGSIDDAVKAYFKQAGIDSGEGIRTLVAAMRAGEGGYARMPVPVPEARTPLLRDDAARLMAAHEAEIGRMLGGLEPRTARQVQMGLEAGLPRVVEAVRAAVGKEADKAQTSLTKALEQAAAEVGGPERLADQVAIHTSANPIEIAAAMRRSPDMVDASVPLGTDVMRMARAMAALDGDAFTMVHGGEVPVGVASAVADLVPPGLHSRVLHDLKRAGAATAREAEALIPELLPPPKMDAPEFPGSRIDDPMGPEAKANTERLAAEHAEAVAAAEAPIKMREKLEAKVEELKGEIAKLEAEAAAADKAQQIAPRAGFDNAEFNPAKADSPQLLAAITDPEAAKLAKLRRDLIDTELQLLAMRAERVADDPAALYRLVMRSSAVQRQRDLDNALTAALRFAGRVLPEGTKVEIKPDAAMVHVGKDGTRYQLDATSDPKTGDVALALHALDPAGRIGHEGVHTLVTRGHISPEEVALLAKVAREAGVFANEAKYREAYKDRANFEALIEEEAAAHLIEAVVNGKVKVDMPATLIERIKALIERIRSYLNGAGFHTPEDVIHAIVSGEAARRMAQDAWMRHNDFSAVAVKEPLAALRDTPSINDKISNIEAAQKLLESLPRDGRRSLGDKYDVSTATEFQRQGFASSLYDAIEADIGKKLSPSGEFMDQRSWHHWMKRDPGAMKRAGFDKQPLFAFGPDAQGRSSGDAGKMFAINNNEPRTPLHDDMEAIDRMQRFRELVEACR